MIFMLFSNTTLFSISHSPSNCPHPFNSVPHQPEIIPLMIYHLIWLYLGTPPDKPQSHHTINRPQTCHHASREEIRSWKSKREIHYLDFGQPRLESSPNNNKKNLIFRLIFASPFFGLSKYREKAWSTRLNSLDFFFHSPLQSHLELRVEPRRAGKWPLITTLTGGLLKSRGGKEEE